MPASISTLTNPAMQDGPYCEIVMIDADLATLWLGNNVRNRRVRPDKVKEYANAMSRGEWRLGGCIIAFDTDGALINGQHTLLALQEAKDVIISVVVAYNCEPETYDVMDQGPRRSLADLLTAEGRANAAALATALNWGYRFGLVEQKLTRGPSAGNGLTPTSTQLLEILAENPDVEASIMPASRVSRFYKIPSGGLAWLHYQMSQVDPGKANEFLYLLQFGEYPSTHPRAGQALGQKNPINALRRTLTENLAAKTRRMRSEHMMALVIKAANLWYAEKEAQVIKFISSEDYPVLKWTPRRRASGPTPQPIGDVA